MNRFLRVLFLMVYLAVETNPVYAQCDEGLKPVSNSKLAYQTWSNRCEGFFASEVAANRMRLVSFTRGDLRYAAEENEIIEISSTESKLLVRAEGIPNDLYYRMDAELKNGRFTWPVKDILLQNERTRLARNIGLLAFKRDSLNNKTYFPVKASGKLTPLEDPNKLPLLKLVCTTTLAQVEWRVNGEQLYTKLNKSSFLAFSPILIRIPEAISGKHQLQIRAKEANSTRWLTLNVNVNL